MSTTFDPSNSSATLSNGNLTASFYTSQAFSDTTKTSGKAYCELVLNSGTEVTVGISTASGVSVGWGNTIAFQNVSGLSIGDVIGLRLDADAKTFDVYINNTYFVTKTFSASGPYYLIAGLGADTAEVTARFSASVMSYPSQGDFAAWDSGGSSLSADFTVNTMRIAFIPVSLDMTADTKRIAYNPLSSSFTADTKRIAAWLADFLADTKRMTGKTSDFISDTKRNVFSGCDFPVDTKRQIANSLSGYKSLVVTLEAKTLSDTFKIDTYNALTMQQIFSSQINDFPFNCFIDSADLDTKTGLSSATAHYDIEQLLYNPIYLGYLSFPSQYTSSYIMGRLIQGLGKSANILIDDHMPPVDFGSTLYTYRDLAAMLFGWTDQLPNIKTNVYMRGNTVNVIQRGHETGNVSLVKYDYAKVSQKYVRTLMFGPKYGGVIGGSVIGRKPPKTSGSQYFSGTVGDGDESVSYSNGLTTSETHTNNGVTQTTTYSYSASLPPAYILERVQTNPTQQVVTTYSYSGTVMQKETETTYTPDGSGGWTAGTVKTTRYVPLGSTFYSIVVESNDKVVSTSITRGIPSGLASAFEIQQDDTRLHGNSGSEVRPTCTLPGVYLGSGSFPVSDSATMTRIGNAIVYLHGSTEERVSLKCYDYSIMDFANTYNWNGNKYFLERNTITYGARRMEQAVELVRYTPGYLGTAGSPA